MVDAVALLPIRFFVFLLKAAAGNEMQFLIEVSLVISSWDFLVLWL